MNNNLDLRVRRTYKCLMDALLELLKEKSLDDITVNELCEKAIVGRGTFYKHFSDKYEFFSFVLGEMFEYYLKEAETARNDGDPRAYYISFFKSFIRFTQENRNVFGSLSSSSMTTFMLFATSDTLSEKLEASLRKDVENGFSLSVSPTAAARFLTGAMAQSARYFIEHEEDPLKEDLESDMCILISKLFE